MSAGSSKAPLRAQRAPHPPLSAEVLDVTLRDGGYLNDWRFSDSAVRALVEALGGAGVPYLELGYISDDRSRPPLLRCSVPYLEELRDLSAGSRIVAMLSVGEKTRSELVRCLRSRREVLDVVRLTCSLERTPQILAAAEFIAQEGITCSINLISITAYEPEEIVACVERIDRVGVADWLYLADSRGALLTDAAASLFADVRAAWTGRLGFHAHDNLGLAATNSRYALEAGFDLIDGSLNGYGLGGGNTDLLEALALAPPGNPEYAQLIVEVASMLAAELALPPPYRHLYPLAGLKNLEQEWVPDVWEAHGAGSEAFLAGLPWRRYKGVEEIVP